MNPELLLTIAAIVTAVGVLVAAIMSIYKVARRIGDAIGVDASGRSIADRLDRVEHQLWENGGTSLADRVNRIEIHAESTASKLELIENLLLSGLINSEPKKPIRKTRAKTPSSLQ
jgi:hypothetical protein